MGQVSITVNGRDYQIACDDGEEEHLAYLASYISHHADDLVGSAGQVGEARLLLMTALVLADELSTAFSELDELRGGGGGGNGSGLMRPAGTDNGDAREAMEALVARLERLAERLEST